MDIDSNESVQTYKPEKRKELMGGLEKVKANPANKSIHEVNYVQAAIC